MNPKLSIAVAFCLVAAVVSRSRAEVYSDATNDLFTSTAPQLDLASVVVTNDSANVSFTIKVVGNPILTNWGSYAVALVTGPGGATNSNGSGAAIGLTRGMNYWLTCLGWGSQQIYKFNTNTLTWAAFSGGLAFANTGNSVTLTVPLASIGLTGGATFQFDAYTFSGSGGAVDDLANPSQASSWWNVSYLNNLVFTYPKTNPVSAPIVGAVNVSVSEDTNTVLWRNPGKGWVAYGTTFPSSLPAPQQAMVNMLYFRTTWATLEPSENVYNWSAIDNAITSAGNNGVKVAFGVMNADVEPYVTPNATPQWVFGSGAGYYVVGTNGGYAATNFYLPYWSTNPIFLAKMDAFIVALGQRYDGNTNIAWIDLRNYGEWGEGHLGNINTATNGQNISSISPSELETNYIQPYLNAFPNTHLILPWGAAAYASAYTWATQQGVGMRRDGIPDYNDGSDITFASGFGPAVIEYSDSYDNLVAEGRWTNAVVAADILRAKASYSEISWSSDFLNNFSNTMTGIENQMGYHFVVTNVALPPWVSSVSTNPIAMNWVNRGVTYLYEPCSIAMALLDGGNNVIGMSWLPEVHPKGNWAPGPVAVTSAMSFNGVPAGSYQLAVGLFTSTNQAQPNFRLGNKGRTANGWYVITNISLLNLPRPATYPTNLTAIASGDGIAISWPADHLGWTLEVQTNSALVGIGSNWVSLAGSSTTNTVNFPYSPNNPSVFFRLKY